MEFITPTYTICLLGLLMATAMTAGTVGEAARFREPADAYKYAVTLSDRCVTLEAGPVTGQQKEV